MVVGMLALGLDFVPVTKQHRSSTCGRWRHRRDCTGDANAWADEYDYQDSRFSSTMGDGGTTNIGGAPLPVDLTGTKRIEIVYNYSGLSGTGTLLFGFRLSDDTYVLPGSVPQRNF